jgi:hypothetical protein
MLTALRTSRQAPILIDSQDISSAFYEACLDEDFDQIYLMLEFIPIRRLNGMIVVKYKLEDYIREYEYNHKKEEWIKYAVYSEYLWVDENTPPDDVFTFVLTKGDYKEINTHYLAAFTRISKVVFGSETHFFMTVDKLKVIGQQKVKNPATKKTAKGAKK